MSAFLHSDLGRLAIPAFLVAAIVSWIWARRRDLRLREERRRNGDISRRRPPSQFLAFIAIGAVVAIMEALVLIFDRDQSTTQLVISIVILIAGIAFVAIGIVGYPKAKKRERDRSSP